MKKILFIPLDERPCNYIYPQELVEIREDLQLMIPPLEILGKKKQPAQLSLLWDFVENNISQCDAFVFSAEMLFYGGLLPSRLHHYSISYFDELLERLKRLKQNHPKCQFYAFQLIMRTPRYSSDDEEPDYYGVYGEQIFKRAYLMNKQSRISLSEDECKELASYNVLIPSDIINDYENRRAINLQLNINMIHLVDEGIINYLSIPQDDSCEFGYTALDQAKVVGEIAKLRLQTKIMMYPGADEAGCEVLARAISEMDQKVTKVYPFYASHLGPSIIPLYEDRIMVESLKSHLMVAHCEIVDSKEDADFILAINCPGKMMQEAFDQDTKDITYSSYRNLNWFVSSLKNDLLKGYKVVVADCAYANGGDLELIQLLDDYEILDQLYAYKGWNTHCNTLGTTIAQMVICHHKHISPHKIVESLIYHLLEDGFYQALLRKEMTATLQEPLNYFDLCDKQPEIAATENIRLKELYQYYIRHSFKNKNIDCIDVYHPWNRMFEIGIHLCISSVVI